MAKTILDLEPQAVWSNFNKLCSVPHPSHHLEQITKLLSDFGKGLGLETIVDQAGNVIIRKPATKGYENATPVILQAHMDMVPQKLAEKAHDFEKDPITTIVDGEWLRADGTTLGADNGIGVAVGMAVLESNDIEHGPLELFITADEETGMYGAFGLKEGELQGKLLINMDSETFGELYVGCAGGIDANISWKYQGVAIPVEDIAVKINISGLKGGHSGMEINMGHANANKLLFRILKDAVAQYEARLARVEGGNMRNAIPRDAYAVVTIPAEGKEDIEKLCNEYETLFNEEYKLTENPIVVTCEEVEAPDMIIPEEIQDDFINAITGCPNGVFRMIPAIPDTVETSMNLAIVEADAENISVKCLLRSSVDSKKEELASMVESVFELAGAKVEFSGSYSGWNPNLDSKILHVMKDVYKEQFGAEADIKVIHAGLECGILGAIETKLDMVSVGPTIEHPHTPSEHVNIESVEKFWRYITATLKNIKD